MAPTPMALLPGQEKVAGEGMASSVLRLGQGAGEGSNGQGSLLGLGWLRGQQSQQVRGLIPGGVQRNPTPGSELCWGQGSVAS